MRTVHTVRCDIKVSLRSHGRVALVAARPGVETTGAVPMPLAELSIVYVAVRKSLPTVPVLEALVPTRGECEEGRCEEGRCEEGREQRGGVIREVRRGEGSEEVVKRLAHQCCEQRVRGSRRAW